MHRYWLPLSPELRDAIDLDDKATGLADVEIKEEAPKADLSKIFGGQGESQEDVIDINDEQKED